DDEDRLVIDRFWRALKPGGVFVLDTRNRDQLVRSLPPEERKRVNGWTVRIENAFDPATSRWRARWWRIKRATAKSKDTGERVGGSGDETEAGLVRAAVEAEGILFRIRPSCTASLMAACKKLRVVGRHGVGLDTVDIPAATRLGVAVVHAPGSNSQAVAEHALMLMLACVKRTRLIDTLTRKGDWGATRVVGNTELAGKTLGIVGV